MKQLMKAIAFAMVMCMLLSTAAFANIGTSDVDTTAKTLNVTIDGVGEEEQVTLLVLKTSAELETLASDDILYINQTASNAEGSATFAVALDTTETHVDIYSGNATYASDNENGFQFLGNIEVGGSAVTNVLISTQETGIVEGSDGIGAYATVDFTTVPEGYTLSKMVWALETADGYLYTNPVELADYGYEVIEAESGLKFAAQISGEYSFTGNADVIFLFVNEAEETKEVYSDNQATHESAKN